MCFSTLLWFWLSSAAAVGWQAWPLPLAQKCPSLVFQGEPLQFRELRLVELYISLEMRC